MLPCVPLYNPNNILGTDDMLLSKKDKVPIPIDLYYRSLIAFVTWRNMFKFAMKYQVAILVCYWVHMYNYGINMKENLGSSRLCLFSYMHACIHSLHQSLLLLLIGFAINTNLKSLCSFKDYFRYHLSRPHWSLFL